MKKLIWIMAVMIFTACQSGGGLEEENGRTPFIPEITISPEELSFPVEGGEKEVAITANFDYNVSEKTDWISVEQTETGLLVKANKSERAESRYADIIITNKEYEIEKFITVSQAAFEPSITVKPSAITFTADGGEQEVVITSNVDFEVSCRASWLSVEQTEVGFVVIAEKSENTSERTANISIINEKYSITKIIEIIQMAWEPKLELSQQYVEFEFEPNSYTVEVSSPYSWQAESDNDWIIVESKTGIAGVENLEFKVARNEEEKERKGTIIVYNSINNLSAELYVIQKAFVPEFTVANESLTFAAESSAQEVAITANFEYEVDSSAEWFSCVKTENGLTVTVPDYVEVEERTAEITISKEKYNISKVIKVTQTAFVPELSATTTYYECDYKGGEFTVPVISNFDYDVTTTADWVKYTKDKEGVKVSVQKHNYVESRSAEVKIYSEKYNLEGATIYITQGAVSIEIGAIITVNGAQGVVFYFDDTETMIVSIEETQKSWSAAEVWCADYGEDWYLPNLYELKQIYNNRTAINATLEANGYTILGNGGYWSIVRTNSRANAYYFSFKNGDSDYCSPDYSLNVRAVLVF